MVIMVIMVYLIGMVNIVLDILVSVACLICMINIVLVIMVIRSDRISVHQRNSLSVCLSVCLFSLSCASNMTHFIPRLPYQPGFTLVNPSEPK